MSEWYCPKCQSYVSGESVTYEEMHELCGTFIGVVWQDEHASLRAEVRQAVIELVEEDKWEEPMMRLCKIAGIEYPAITTDVTPQSVADALSKDGKL